MSDGGWLNAPAGLIRTDGSSKPAYEELLRPVKDDWWIQPPRFVTDEHGEIPLTGFLGDYELTWGGKSATFSLTKEDSVIIQT